MSHVGKSFANPHQVQFEDGSLSKVGSYHGAGYEKGFEFHHYAKKLPSSMYFFVGVVLKIDATKA